MTASQNFNTANLAHKGATQDAGPGFENYVLKLGPGGTLPSIPASSVVFPVPEGVYYVDDSIGDDSTGDGSIVKPFKTIAKAISENAAGSPSDMANIAFVGVAKDKTTITGTITFGNVSGSNVASFFDLTAATVSDTDVGGTFNVRQYSANLTTATSANASNTGTALVTPASNTPSLTNISVDFEPDADSVGYTPAVPGDWGPVPSVGNTALDQLAARTAALEGDFVEGPASAVNDNLPSYDGTTGKLIKDSGISANDVVVGPLSATDLALALFDGTKGKLIQDSGTTISDLFTGPGSSTDDHIVVFDGTSGKLVKDSGVNVNNVVVGPVSAVNENIAVYDGVTGKLIKDSGISISGLGDTGKVKVNSTDTTIDFMDIKMPVTGAVAELITDAGGSGLTLTR
jgi:hypothetical protein